MADDALKTGVDLYALDPSKIKWVIPKLLQAGSVDMWAAEPAKGKTMIALALSIAKSIGAAPFNHEDFKSEQGAVLYINGDAGMYEIARRYKRLTKEPSKEFVYLSGEGLKFDEISGKEDVGRLRALGLIRTIKAHNIKLVVIDTFRNVVSGDENDSGDMERFFSNMRKIAEATDCAILILHHINKASVSNRITLKSIRGSTVLGAACDDICAIEMTDKDEETKSRTFLIYNIKSRTGLNYPDFNIMVYDKGEKTEVQYIDTVYQAKTKVDICKGKIIEYLATRNDVGRAQIILDFQGDFSKSTMEQALRSLVKEKKIVSDGGEYSANKAKAEL